MTAEIHEDPPCPRNTPTAAMSAMSAQRALTATSASTNADTVSTTDAAAMHLPAAPATAAATGAAAATATGRTGARLQVWTCAACDVVHATWPRNGSPIFDGPVCEECDNAYVLSSRLAACIVSNNKMIVGVGQNIRGRVQGGLLQAAFSNGCIVVSGTVTEEDTPRPFTIRLVVDVIEGVVRLVPTSARGMCVAVMGTIVRFDNAHDLPFWIEIDVAPMRVVV